MGRPFGAHYVCNRVELFLWVPAMLGARGLCDHRRCLLGTQSCLPSVRPSCPCPPPPATACRPAGEAGREVAAGHGHSTPSAAGGSSDQDVPPPAPPLLAVPSADGADPTAGSTGTGCCKTHDKGSVAHIQQTLPLQLGAVPSVLVLVAYTPAFRVLHYATAAGVAGVLAATWCALPCRVCTRLVLPASVLPACMTVKISLLLLIALCGTHTLPQSFLAAMHIVAFVTTLEHV